MPRSRRPIGLALAALAAGAALLLLVLVLAIANRREPPAPLVRRGPAEPVTTSAPPAEATRFPTAAAPDTPPAATPPRPPEDEREPDIRGRVVDPEGNPVRGAEVALFVVPERETLGSQSASAQFLDRTETDASGAFSFSRRDRRDRHRLRADSEGRAPRIVDGIHAGAFVEIVLDAGSLVTGRVLAAADSSPLAGARVECHGALSEEGGLPLRESESDTRLDTAVTDEAGRFTCGRAPHGWIRVDAAAAGYAPSSRFVFVNAGSVADVEFHLDDGVTIEGVVLEADTARAVEGARVELAGSSRNEDSPVLRAEVTTGADGSFRFEDLRRRDFRDVPPELALVTTSRYEVRASAPSGLHGVASVDLGATGGADPAPVVIRLAREAAVSFSVRVEDDAGAPVVGASVDWIGVDADWARRTEGGGRTDSEGLVAFDGLPASHAYRFWARRVGHATATAESSAGAEGRVEIVCVLPRSSGRVRVRVAWPDGRPVAGASVTLVAPEGGAIPEGLEAMRRIEDRLFLFEHPRREKGRTDDAGLFVSDAIGEGLVAYEVAHDLAIDAAVGTIEAGSGNTVVAVTLVPGGSIDGVVRDQDGAPLAHRLVIASTMPVAVFAERRQSRCATTDASGRFRIDGIDPARQYQVYARSGFAIGGTGLDDRSRFCRENVVAGDRVELRLLRNVDYLE